MELDNGYIHVVESILGERKKRGKVYYLIKWKDYEETSWEPRENILDVDLIKEWNIRKTRDGSFISKRPKKRSFNENLEYICHEMSSHEEFSDPSEISKKTEMMEDANRRYRLLCDLCSREGCDLQCDLCTVSCHQKCLLDSTNTHSVLKEKIYESFRCEYCYRKDPLCLSCNRQEIELPAYIDTSHPIQKSLVRCSRCMCTIHYFCSSNKSELNPPYICYYCSLVDKNPHMFIEKGIDGSDKDRYFVKLKDNKDLSHIPIPEIWVRCAVDKNLCRLGTRNGSSDIHGDDVEEGCRSESLRFSMNGYSDLDGFGSIIDTSSTNEEDGKNTEIFDSRQEVADDSANNLMCFYESDMDEDVYDNSKSLIVHPLVNFNRRNIEYHDKFRTLSENYGKKDIGINIVISRVLVGKNSYKALIEWDYDKLTTWECEHVLYYHDFQHQTQSYNTALRNYFDFVEYSDSIDKNSLERYTNLRKRNNLDKLCRCNSEIANQLIHDHERFRARCVIGDRFNNIVSVFGFLNNLCEAENSGIVLVFTTNKDRYLWRDICNDTFNSSMLFPCFEIRELERVKLHLENNTKSLVIITSWSFILSKIDYIERMFENCIIINDFNFASVPPKLYEIDCVNSSLCPKLVVSLVEANLWSLVNKDMMYKSIYFVDKSLVENYGTFCANYFHDDGSLLAERFLQDFHHICVYLSVSAHNCRLIRMVDIHTSMSQKECESYKSMANKVILEYNDPKGPLKIRREGLQKQIKHLIDLHYHPLLDSISSGNENKVMYWGLCSIDDIISNSGKFCVLDKLFDRLHEKGSKVVIVNESAYFFGILTRYLSSKNYKYLHVTRSPHHISGFSNALTLKKNVKEADSSDGFICIIVDKDSLYYTGLFDNIDSYVFYDIDYKVPIKRCACLKKPVSVYRIIINNTVEETYRSFPSGSFLDMFTTVDPDTQITIMGDMLLKTQSQIEREDFNKEIIYTKSCVEKLVSFDQECKNHGSDVKFVGYMYSRDKVYGEHECLENEPLSDGGILKEVDTVNKRDEYDLQTYVYVLRNPHEGVLELVNFEIGTICKIIGESPMVSGICKYILEVILLNSMNLQIPASEVENDKPKTLMIVLDKSYMHGSRIGILFVMVHAESNAWCVGFIPNSKIPCRYEMIYLYVSGSDMLIKQMYRSPIITKIDVYIGVSSIHVRCSCAQEQDKIFQCSWSSCGYKTFFFTELVHHLSVEHLSCHKTTFRDAECEMNDKQYDPSMPYCLSEKIHRLVRMQYNSVLYYKQLNSDLLFENNRLQKSNQLLRYQIVRHRKTMHKN